MLNAKSDVIGEINIRPNPIIWKVVLYFPNKSDLTSAMFFDLEITNNLKLLIEISLVIIRIDEIKMKKLSKLDVIQINITDTKTLSANKSRNAPKSEARLFFRAK